MSITSEEAVRIAKAHGLSLTDAASLQRLATTADEATALARTFVEPSQLTRQDVRQLYKEGRHDEIVQAQKEGRLDDLLSGKKQTAAQPAPPVEPPAPERPEEGMVSGAVGPEDTGSQLTREDLKRMSSAQIVSAAEAGRLDQLLGR